MPDTKELVTQKQIKAILETTDPKYVKQRPGRGGTMLDYVETGYIIKRLNETFNYLWSFDIVEKEHEGLQVAIKGKLTVFISPELSISKTQFGTYEMKNSGSFSTPLGDAYKSAASDALKKCASLFGIAQDIFWGGYNAEEDLPDNTSVPGVGTQGQAGTGLATVGQRMLVKKLMDEGKVAKDYSKLNTITFSQAREIIQKYNG